MATATPWWLAARRRASTAAMPSAGRRRHRRRLRRRRRTGRDPGQAAQRARRLPGRRLSGPADDLHSAWAQLFAASLAQCGVAHAVISPGSRSTPLALALAAQLPSTVLHDERVAAFFALGQARASGRPSVVLATSGTAPGHWLPAVMEAREAGLPLLLRQRRPAVGSAAGAGLADGRPACACSATMRKPISSSACPTPTRPRCARCRASPRRPCSPRSTRWPARCRSTRTSASRWSRSRATDASPGVRGSMPSHGPARRDWWRRRPRRTRRPWRSWWQQVRAAPRGVLVAGPMPALQAADWPRGADAFVAASGYVLLAEATSQLRFGLDAAAQDACMRRLRRAAARAGPAPAAAPGPRAGDRRASGVGALARLDRRRRRARAPGAARRASGRSRPAARKACCSGRWRTLLDAAAAQLQAQPRARLTQPPPARLRQRLACRRGAAWRRAAGAAERSRRGGRRHATAEHHIAPLFARRCPPAPCWRSAIPARCATSTTTCRPTPGRWPCCTSAAPPASTAWSPAPPARAACSLRRWRCCWAMSSLLHDAGGLAAAAAVRGPLAIVVINNDGGRIFERLPLGRDRQRGRSARAALRHPARPRLRRAGRHLGARLRASGHAGRAGTRRWRGRWSADRAMLIEARAAPGGSASRAVLLAAMAAVPPSRRPRA